MKILLHNSKKNGNFAANFSRNNMRISKNSYGLYHYERLDGRDKKDI